jgi:hypothetical protein
MTAVVTGACLAVIANLCIHSAEGIHFADTALVSYAEISGRNFRATLFLRTDNNAPPDWSKMNLTCIGGTCVAYHKHCESRHKRFVCDYYFSQPGDKENSFLQIVVKNAAALKETEMNFGILSRSNWTSGEIGFGQFTILSQSGAAPDCGARDLPFACWPRPVPEAVNPKP